MCLLAALALCVGGCTPGGSGGPAPSRRDRPAPGTPTAATPAAVLVRFERHGGIAGFADDLTVRVDGRFTLVRSRPTVTRTGQLTAAELADLRTRLADADLAHLPTRQLGRGSDLFTYRVIAGEIQILAQDGAVATPLQPLIAALVALVNRAGS